jgi:hypothetical protein
MAKEKVSSSFLDTLGSGFDAKGVDGPQLGKAHEEEVAAKDNWNADKRDAIGRAAFVQKRKRIARKLRRLAREIEALERAEMNSGYKSTIEEAAGDEDIVEVIDDEAKGKGAEDMELADEEAMYDDDEADSDEVPEDLNAQPEQPENLEASDDEDDDEDEDDEEDAAEEDFINVEASHPIEHNPKKDDPKADGSAQTGDEDWISIGPGTFKDKRDALGRAAD